MLSPTQWLPSSPICGGILGARFGIDWIRLERFQDKERLVEYAEAMVESQGSCEGKAGFLTKEAELTKQEADFQSAMN
ncbi:MAG: hypothetical protein WBG70_23495 [Spirulinaceae cyanobacterium]